MDPDAIFAEIDAQLETLSIGEIKERLEPLIVGARIRSPIISSGAYVYRARKLGLRFNRAHTIKFADLIYPSPHLAGLGRLT